MRLAMEVEAAAACGEVVDEPGCPSRTMVSNGTELTAMVAGAPFGGAIAAVVVTGVTGDAGLRCGAGITGEAGLRCDAVALWALTLLCARGAVSTGPRDGGRVRRGSALLLRTPKGVMALVPAATAEVGGGTGAAMVLL